MSATKSGYTRFDNLVELQTYINNLKITRTVNGLQVHHMGLPDYDCFYKSNGSTEDELTRTINLNSYGVSKGWGCIARHFNIFPNGKVTTGRDINKTPVGITGWNTNKICIEIYGDFDKGKDTMTEAQRKTVIALYGMLCKKLNLTPSTTTIRPHAWFDSSGNFLGDYSATKSRKSCPGTNFMGYGNTKSTFANSFYPLVKEYISTGKIEGTTVSSSTAESMEVVNLTGVVCPLDEGDILNVRSGPNSSYGIVGTLEGGTTIDIVGRYENGWFKIKYNNDFGYVNSKYVTDIEPVVVVDTGKYIVRYLQQVLNAEYRCGLVVDGLYGAKTKAVIETKYLKINYKGEHVKWLQQALVNRGYDISIDGSFGAKTKTALISYQKSRNLTADGVAGLNTHTTIVND